MPAYARSIHPLAAASVPPLPMPVDPADPDTNPAQPVQVPGNPAPPIQLPPGSV